MKRNSECMITLFKNWRIVVDLREGFPVSSATKELACNAGDPGLIPGSGRSAGEGISYPLQYSGLENSMDRGACKATYSPWGRKEPDTTARLSLSLWESKKLNMTDIVYLRPWRMVGSLGKRELRRWRNLGRMLSLALFTLDYPHRIRDINYTKNPSGIWSRNEGENR